MAPNAALEREQELRLLDAMLAGEHSAARVFFEHFNQLVEMTVRRVFRGAGIVPSEDEVYDAVADVWLFLLEEDMRSLRRFEPSRNIRISTWVSLLARNRTIDHLRSRHGRYISVDSVVLESQVGTAPSPSDEIEAHERARLAAAAVSRLGAADRRFLEAWYVEDRQPDELAHEFGIAVGTVYSRRFKIQQKLERLISRFTRPVQRWRHAAAAH